MKRIFVLLIFTLLFVCVSSFAQNKIAVVDVNAFYDKKSGINELVIANNQLETEFKSSNEELRALKKRLEELVIYVKRFETTNFPESYFKENKEKHEKMYLEIQVLPNKIKAKTDELISRIEKRKSEIVDPVFKRVIEKSEVFKKNKGFLIILDQSKMESSFFIYEEDSSIDITKEFIKFCNEEFEKEKAQKQ